MKPKEHNIEIGSAVRCKTRWGAITGKVTKLYSAYDFKDEETGEIVHVPEIAEVIVDKIPERWPYDNPAFAPEVSRLKLIDSQEEK